MNTQKRKVCQYGSDCYRKNPTHFSEYSHPHLEDILASGINSETNEYEIPDEYVMTKDVIAIQLKILEKLFPQMKVASVDDKKKKKEQPKPKEKPVERANEAKPQKKAQDSPVYMIEDDDEDEVASVASTSSKQDSNQSASASTSSRNLGIQDKSATKDKLSPIQNTPSKVRNRSPSPSTSSKPQSSDNSNLAKKPKITKNIHEYIPVVLPKGQMAKKLERAAPYNFFLTAITESPRTHSEPLTVTLQEILDESLGVIESSVQINFMVEIGWLLGHYYFAGCLETPLLILYGDETPDLRTISEKKPQVTAIKVQMPSPFATHHTKMMLFGYTDGSMRVVISTANLYEDDWHNRTQGVWISPKLTPLSPDADTGMGDSPTGFRNDLMLYLVEYKIPKLQPWITRIRKTDFSAINVFFIASVPGGFRPSARGHPWGAARLGTLLSKHSAPIDDSCPVVAQSSSIGSLGPNIQTWISADFVNNLRKDSAPVGLRRVPQFKMIYPSFGNVKNSHDGMLGGGCLPYSGKTNEKQLWLKDYLHQWKSDSRFRTKAMPHIKTYCRWSDRGLYWFVLTSANLSKAAWGAFNKSSKIEPAFRIMNYEAGVVFFPKFVIGENRFPIGNDKDGIPKFPIPYDIPLTPYGMGDKPFLMDYLMAQMG